MKADSVVSALLEDDYDAHMKDYKRVQHWDKAHASTKELYGLKKKALGLFKELGISIAYNRALAHVGLKPEDVERAIRGAQVAATDNYKHVIPINACSNTYCSAQGKSQPMDRKECGQCGSDLSVKQIKVPPSLLRGKWANYIVGVVTKSGKKVFFKEPVPPEIEYSEND
jgi:hypothetical protein